MIVGGGMIFFLRSSPLVKLIKSSYLRELSKYKPPKMAIDAKFAAVPNVDIEEGIFKYVLIKVYSGATTEGGEEVSKNIVRGYADCQWHSDIYDRASASCKGLGFETECLGGGRIEHNPGAKLIKVYGYSQGFGKADHGVTRNILKTKYTDYDIQISDEGY